MTANSNLKICKVCGEYEEFDGGEIDAEKAGRIFQRACKCVREKWEKEKLSEQLERIEQLRGKCIPKIYHNWRFEADDGADKETISIAQKYAENFEKISESGQGLLLWGAVGTGKTFSAICIANALIDKGIPATVTSFAEVARIARDFEQGEVKFVGLLRNRLIVVDDIGKELPTKPNDKEDTKFTLEAIYRFVNECSLRSIPLILTTNLLPSELEKAADNTTDLTYARIYSRLLERVLPVKVNLVKRREETAKKTKSELETLLKSNRY